MKKICLATLLFAAISLFVSCDKDDQKISYDNLPAQAKTFLTDNFKTTQVARVEKEENNEGYDVYLSDRTEIDFDINGLWESVECKTIAVPTAIVPKKISEYVTTNYPNSILLQIDKRNFIKGGYEVELNNNIELIFDQDGNFVRIDL